MAEADAEELEKLRLIFKRERAITTLTRKRASLLDLAMHVTNGISNNAKRASELTRIRNKIAEIDNQIDRLEDEINQIENGEQATAFTPPSPDEVKALRDAVNGVADLVANSAAVEAVVAGVTNALNNA